MVKSKNLQSRLFTQEKLSFRIKGHIKSFPDKKKLKGVDHHQTITRNVKGLSFQLGPGIMAPTKKGGEKKKGPSAINKVMIREIHHQCSQAHPRSGFQEVCPLGTQKDLEIRHDGDGNSGCAHWHQAQQCCLGQRNKECSIPYPRAIVQKDNENEDSPNKLCMLVIYVSVTTFKNLHDNCWFSNKVIKPRTKKGNVKRSSCFYKILSF